MVKNHQTTLTRGTLLFKWKSNDIKIFMKFLSNIPIYCSDVQKSITKAHIGI
jgi:hypothetical protein